MDRLRSPGGCPWDARQTHLTLRRYLQEETYEVLEAIEAGDPAELREELGDLLLQVVFHARVAQENPPAAGGFDIDDVAAAIVAKLVRRHPHVFADDQLAADAPTEDLQRRWDAIKAQEKPRTSVLDGIPLALPALARADKVLGRLQRNGIETPVAAQELSEEQVGAELLQLVRRAHAAGVDPEAALRAATAALEARARDAERA